MIRRSAALLAAVAASCVLPANAAPLPSAAPAPGPSQLPAPSATLDSPAASAIELHLPACSAGPFDAARFVALLRVELGGIGISDVRTSGSPAPAAPLANDLLAAVIVSTPGCEPSAPEVTLQVVDRVTSKIVERAMALADVAYDERPRALAIAVAELLQASFAELELGATPAPGVVIPPEIHAAIMQRLAPAPVPPAPFLPPVRTPRPLAVEPRPSRTLVEAAGLLRAFPSRETALLGGALAVSLPVGESFRLHFGADAGFGDARATTGTVDVTAVTGSAGIAVVAGRSTSLEIGPRIHAGYAWAAGTPSTGATRGLTYSHVVALALLSATLRVPAQGYTLFGGLDIGAAFAEASFLSDDARVAGFGGVTLGARLGVALGI